MEFNKKKVLVIPLIIFALIWNVSAPFESYQCAGVNACFDASTPTVMCNTGAGGNCPVICAAECGSMTGCMSGSCNTCCAANTCSIYAAGSNELKACMGSCEGTCEVNKEFCGIILILQSIAAGLAVLMLAINGFKWMVADDSQGRIDAKRGVYYVFIGLAVVIISFALVNYLLIGDITCPF